MKSTQLDIFGKEISTDKYNISGEVIRIEYKAPEGAFAVINVQNEDQIFSAVGAIGHVVVGQTVSLGGHWSFHPSFGEQFTVQNIMVDSPKSLRGIILYLTHQIQGIGKSKAQDIVNHFGIQTIHILNTQGHRLSEVKGIGKKTAEKILEQWNRDVRARELEITLRGYGISNSLCIKLIAKYGDDALATIMEDPYTLSIEIKGIGFKTADNIAIAQGLPLDSPQRMKAAIIHLFRQQETLGHCYVGLDCLRKEATKLNLPEEAFHTAIETLMETKELLIAEHAPELAYYRPIMYHVEKKIASNLISMRGLAEPSAKQRLLDTKQTHTLDISFWENTLQLQLNLEQKQAIQTAFTEQLSVITGGPGTGKTTIITVLLRILDAYGYKFSLAAPTGRAAKRMSEATGKEAQTIHRLLGYNGYPGEFQHTADNPINTDVVLIDEASMLDIWLMKSVLDALPPTARLVLIGDVDQLPSVGPGQVLKDLINSSVLPVTRLLHVYRQAQESNIIRNAHIINQGMLPISMEKDKFAGPLRDFFILDRENPADTVQTILTVANEKIRSLGFHPLKDLQILTPMHNGTLGTGNLNEKLQELLNPNGELLETKFRKFKVGDRVLQTKNDYDNDIFNGDVGYVTQVMTDSLYVDFDGKIIHLAGGQLNSLDLAYAVSIHKSQGSEYPAVIVVIHKAHWIMLNRNLLYTAITRAKKFCCIIGSEWAVGVATEQTQGTERNTSLRQWLEILG